MALRVLTYTEAQRIRLNDARKLQSRVIELKSKGALW